MDDGGGWAHITQCQGVILRVGGIRTTHESKCLSRGIGRKNADDILGWRSAVQDHLAGPIPAVVGLFSPLGSRAGVGHP